MGTPKDNTSIFIYLFIIQVSSGLTHLVLHLYVFTIPFVRLYVAHITLSGNSKHSNKPSYHFLDPGLVFFQMKLVVSFGLLF